MDHLLPLHPEHLLQEVLLDLFCLGQRDLCQPDIICNQLQKSDKPKLVLGRYRQGYPRAQVYPGAIAFSLCSHLCASQLLLH